MKTKLHLLFFAMLFSVGLQAQTVTVTSSLPGTIETGDLLSFTADYTTDSDSYNLIVRFYEDNGGTITRFGSDQSFTSIPSNSTGTETLTINAPTVAATNYIARVFIEGPAPDYNKVFAPDIPFTVIAKVIPVKDSYLFNTDGDTEGWETGSIGAPNITATVAGGIMVVNTGSGSWDVGYIEQTEFKSDPTIHNYVHILYKNLSKPNENDQIELDWITTGATRSARVVVPIETSGWSTEMDFTTVTYDLGSNAEWTGADATYFRIYISRAGGGPKSKDLEIDSIIFNNIGPANNFTGTTDSDWNTPTNWSLGTIPTITSNVVIPASETVIIDATTGAVANNLTVDGSLSITSGGSLKVAGTSTGNITYNVAIADANWHLVSSPVSGESYGDGTTWIADSSIDSGVTDTNNRGIATYQNGTPDPITGQWTYYNTVGGTETTFGSGTGYSMKASGAATYGFEGAYPTFPVDAAISQQGSNYWNLVGNPTPAYLDVAAFISGNTTKLSPGAFQAVYVYNTAGGYTSVSGYIHPGQAFFVNSNVASGTVSTTAAMLSANNETATFYKGGNTSVELKVTEGNSYRKAYLEYSNDGTLGLDPGKDIGVFNGVATDFSIYTNLLENNEDIAFERQALPETDLESMEISVGLVAAAGKEITISATSLNLPEGVKVILEDRVLNVFTNLNESDYSITLDSDLNGVGRFYVKTTSASVLSTENTTLSGVHIYNTNNTLKVVGLEQGNASVSLYNILGKNVMNTTFNGNSLSLPVLAKGIYIVKITTDKGTLSKKIIL